MRISTASKRAIKDIHFIQDEPNRHPIHHYMVKIDDQNVLGFANLEQGNMKQRKAREVKRLESFLGGQQLESGLCSRGIQFCEMDSDPALGLYALQGLVVFNDEGGSQYFVPSNYFIK